MNKTSVYLSDDEKERLEHLAKVEGRSQADIIREALRAYRPKSRLAGSLLRGAVSDPSVQAARLDDSVLRGIVDRPDVSYARIPEDELLKGFGE